LFALAKVFSAPKLAFQQSVDGLWGTLEIRLRSSYVPSSPIGVNPGFAGRCAPLRGAIDAPGMPIWMK
jgi:hypothetical protein